MSQKQCQLDQTWGDTFYPTADRQLVHDCVNSRVKALLDLCVFVRLISPTTSIDTTRATHWDDGV